MTDNRDTGMTMDEFLDAFHRDAEMQEFAAQSERGLQNLLAWMERQRRIERTERILRRVIPPLVGLAVVIASFLIHLALMGLL